MLVERTINGVEIAVDASQPNEVYFESSFVSKYPKIIQGLTPNELCDIISKDVYTPLLLTWELLDKCSFNCPFCYIVGHSHNRIVPFKKTKPHIEDLLDLGLLYCTLTGGEATLHPEFFEIYSFLKQRGVIVEIYTNGSLITDDLINLFVKFPPIKVEVSIYSTSEEQFKVNAGTKSFEAEKILDNILRLKAAGINVVCKTPLNKTTETEFEKIVDWCKFHGVTFYYSTNVDSGYDGESLKEFESSFEIRTSYESRKHLDIYKKYPSSFENTSITSKTCYTCSIRKYGLHINSNFELMPCSETHLEESKSDILQVGIKNSVLKYRTFVSQFIGKPIIGCSGCEASSICKMCTAKAVPVQNSSHETVDFKVPEGHCEEERRKIRSINEKIMAQA